MGDPSVTVRRTVESDWEALRALRLRALADAPEAFGRTVSEERDLPESAWRDRARGTDAARSFIAESGDEQVGLIALGVEPNGTAQLLSMWVDARFRGTGLAAELVAKVLAAARVRGITRVVLSVTEGNEQARRFYLRLGFADTGVVEPLRSDQSRLTRQLAIDL